MELTDQTECKNRSTSKKREMASSSTPWRLVPADALLEEPEIWDLTNFVEISMIPGKSLRIQAFFSVALFDCPAFPHWNMNIIYII